MGGRAVERKEQHLGRPGSESELYVANTEPYDGKGKWLDTKLEKRTLFCKQWGSSGGERHNLMSLRKVTRWTQTVYLLFEVR